MNQRDLSGRLARWSLSLAGYDFEIEHRKGSENVVPDALSRSFSEHVSALDLCVIDVDLDAPEFEANDYKDLGDQCEANKDTLPDVKVSQNLVYRTTDFPSGSESLDTSIWILWIPSELTESLIAGAHNPPQAAHGGITKTLSRLREKYYWPNMPIQVREYIRRCEICKMSKASNYITRPKMGNETIVERPFQKIYVDLLGPYPRSKKGHTHIFKTLDHFSKFVFLQPLRKADATSIIQFLESQIFAIFGVPELIHSDNGKQFVSKEFAEMTKSYSIRHMFNASYAPQSNASERVNRTVLAAIRS